MKITKDSFFKALISRKKEHEVAISQINENGNFLKGKTAQGGLSVAGGCRCLTKDGNTSIEKEGYIPYPLQA